MKKTNGGREESSTKSAARVIIRRVRRLEKDLARLKEIAAIIKKFSRGLLQ